MKSLWMRSLRTRSLWTRSFCRIDSCWWCRRYNRCWSYWPGSRWWSWRHTLILYVIWRTLSILISSATGYCNFRHSLINQLIRRFVSFIRDWWISSTSITTNRSANMKFRRKNFQLWNCSTVQGKYSTLGIAIFDTCHRQSRFTRLLRCSSKISLVTTFFFNVKHHARNALEKCDFRDLKTETSSGCRACVVWGGRQKAKWYYFHKHINQFNILMRFVAIYKEN